MKVIYLLVASMPWIAIPAQSQVELVPGPEFAGETALIIPHVGNVAETDSGTLCYDCPGGFSIWVPGPKTCNCSDLPVEDTVCHEESVSWSFGGSILSGSTGFSSSNCVTITIPPGLCGWVEYLMECTPVRNWWWSDCTIRCRGTKDKRIKSAPTTPSDCN